MNDTPHRVIIGALPPAGGDVVFVGEEDPVRRAMRQAGAELDRQRAEEERAARAVIRVDKQWLLSVMRDLISRIERDHALAIDAGDYDARISAARTLNRLRADFTFCNAKEPPP